MKIIAVEPIGMSSAQIAGFEEEFARSGNQFVCFPDRNENPKVLIERMHDADVVIISNIKLDRTTLSACPKLKMLSVAFTGLDHIDLEYCSNKEIAVYNASGYATVAVAELAIGLMLDLYRHITILDAATRQSGYRKNFLGRQLKGKTVGVVGTGAIGRETAFALQSLGCKVVAWNRSSHQDVLNHNIPYIPLDELLAISDIITLHLPLTNETKGLISAEKLSLCKPTAILINCARGKIVDMNALSEALKNGLLAGAGIDDYETEPPLPKDHPLLDAPNCLLVPHIGYATREAFDIRIDIVIDNVRNWLRSI